MICNHYCYQKIKAITVKLRVLNSNTSHLEAHAGFFRLLMKGIFDPYVQKVDFLISNAC